MAEIARPELGGYMSTECFRYLRIYAEETAGRGLIVQAGKQRGLSLDDVLKGVSPDDTTTLTTILGQVLGKEGTRLCLVDEITKTAAGYNVRISESACSTGLKASEPNCAFTMGVFIGALEVVTKKRFNAIETACVAVEGNNCIYQLEEI